MTTLIDALLDGRQPTINDMVAEAIGQQISRLHDVKMYVTDANVNAIIENVRTNLLRLRNIIEDSKPIERKDKKVK